MQLNLEGKWALVGGASQGIGAATAQVLADQGVRVILMSRRAEALEKVKSTLKHPSQHMILPADLENIAMLKTILSNVMKSTNTISIFVNITGGPKAGPIADASVDELERAFRGHVLAAQAITQLVLPGMKEQKFGRIVNVLSTSVKMPIPNLGVSNTIRSAMAAWAKTLAGEVAPFGITVNNILPGFTLTPRLDSLAKGRATSSRMSEEQVREEWLDQIPAKRFAEPVEIANAISFLSSRTSGYITGVSLPIDGGRTGSF